MSEGLLVDKLAVRFGAAQIVSDVSLHVEPRERVALVGHNGAGKTTTLRAISGVIARQARELSLGGRALAQNASDVARLGIAHVPEGRGIFRTLTVTENLHVGVAGMGKRFTSSRIEWAVERFPLLKPLLKRTAGVLSGGEQQILAVARGLATEPKLLMVDELSLGLSPKAMSDVLQALVDACSTQGTSLLLVDQNVHAMVDVAERLYVLKSGVTKEVDPSTIHWSDDWLEAI